MKIYTIDEKMIRSIDKGQEEMVFIRPKHSKLFRVLTIPADLAENEEFLQVMHTLAKKFHPQSGIFFFRIPDDEQEDVMQTFLHMQIPVYFAIHDYDDIILNN